MTAVIRLTLYDPAAPNAATQRLPVLEELVNDLLGSPLEEQKSHPVCG